jgi:hypothetical protein
VSDDRCRACGAALAAGSAWCTLCFTEVRQPEPIELSVPVTVPATPAATALPETPVVPVASEAAAPVARPTRHRAEATWPCPTCDARVPMSLDACEECGGQFLAGASTSVSTRLPVVGDVGAMSSTQRFLLAAGTGCVLVVVVVLLFFIGGQFL